jgi:Xaa-Pro aminopeptidase
LNTQIYIERRKILTNSVASGVIIIFGNKLQPRNYPSNILPFRQDSNFLYYTGIDLPDLVCFIDCESNQEFLFGNDPTIEDTVWSGQKPKLNVLAGEAGIQNCFPFKDLSKYLRKAREKGRTIHYLPPYPPDRQLLLSELLHTSPEKLRSGVSVELIQSVVNQRSQKSGEEVGEIEWALENVTAPMHIMAMKMAIPGQHESHIAGEMLNFAQRHNVSPAYPAICSIQGEILHNESYLNMLSEGKLLLIDARAESPKHYASDITRTIPVGGKFSPAQRDIYELVLSTQEDAIRRIRPGVLFRDIHLEAARIIARGMKDLGFMKGNIDDAVNAGAHALFFPHGLGHMMGLDVHDMEDLGEDYVGYDKTVKRSKQFGTTYLRLARKLDPGFVITVEPGIYFISALIDLWANGKKFRNYIDYSRIQKYRDFGGIRIEDNILVTASGNRVLGPRIPKTCTEIEELHR